MRHHEIIIVGSGAGGATLARDLCRQGKDVLILEMGADTFPPPLSIATSQEGIDIYQAFGAGGATVLCNGNGVRALERDLAALGIDLQDEYAALEAELPVAPIADSLLSPEGSLKLLDVFGAAGIPMRRMPKFIDATKCKGCGHCSLGCPNGAKWDCRVFLNDALTHGAEVLYHTTVTQVLIENGRVVGVEATGPAGVERLTADVVVLAAGGLKTPVILQHSGIDAAGRRLFVDLCEIWCGVTPDIDISREPPMQLVYTEMAQEHRISLCTVHVSNREKLRYYFADKSELFSKNHWVGILVKIGDEATGRVFPDGSVSKRVTDGDRSKFEQGGAQARKILQTAGATDDSIIKLDKIYGGHNGATAAIGEVVNTELQTAVAGLFVCDASVLPLAPGLPPMLTIMALAKRLAKTLV
ncbi:FAD-dependent oxidoreductase [Lamprocystis purpurea]|jgi:choline dehydrogenase-like flavoprotein|uniref:FAD-dependent oxidoreductase n=1 Tax=Lamprocystis purpurea TaxID=61598 RepID=UPI0003694CA6|nr:FAD-dependent oxidoreductase [Lamprocystis purpurea]